MEPKFKRGMAIVLALAGAAAVIFAVGTPLKGKRSCRTIEATSDLATICSCETSDVGITRECKTLRATTKDYLENRIDGGQLGAAGAIRLQASILPSLAKTIWPFVRFVGDLDIALKAGRIRKNRDTAGKLVIWNGAVYGRSLSLFPDSSITWNVNQKYSRFIFFTEKTAHPEDMLVALDGKVVPFNTERRTVEVDLSDTRELTLQLPGLNGKETRPLLLIDPRVVCISEDCGDTVTAVPTQAAASLNTPAAPNAPTSTPASVRPTATSTARATATGIPRATLTATPRATVTPAGLAGDGTTDNYDALHRAVAALPSGGTLTIPAGTYRIGIAAGRTGNDGAIEIANKSNITIQGAVGSNGELLSTIAMDNITPGHGAQCHGLVITGQSNNVTIKNLRIAWIPRATARSQGYGVRVLGSANPTLGPSNLLFENVAIDGAPQAGTLVMGAQNITVKNMFVSNTMADGLHFNASRNISIDGLTAYNNGDDSLAFVNYYDPVSPGSGPFNSPDLVTNNDRGARAQHILSVGGPIWMADGIRVAGAYDVQISDIYVVGKPSCFFSDSAMATNLINPADRQFAWGYLASQQVYVNHLNCVDKLPATLQQSPSTANQWIVNQVKWLDPAVQTALWNSSQPTARGIRVEEQNPPSSTNNPYGYKDCIIDPTASGCANASGPTPGFSNFDIHFGVPFSSSPSQIPPLADHDQAICTQNQSCINLENQTENSIFIHRDDVAGIAHSSVALPAIAIDVENFSIVGSTSNSETSFANIYLHNYSLSGGATL